MRDWIFPSLAFLVFLYGAFFINFYIYKFTNSDASLTSNYQDSTKGDVSGFLKDISDSLK